MSPSTNRWLPAWLLAASLALALCLPALAGAHGKPSHGHFPATGPPRPSRTLPATLAMAIRDTPATAAITVAARKST